MNVVRDTSTPASEAALSLLGDDMGPVGDGTEPGGDEPFVRFEHERYRIGARLGQGGMGRVFLAHDLRLDRDVALKEVLRPEPGLAARLRREARLTAALDHPGITPIYDAGRRDDGRLYYTMRLVRGRPLSEVIAASTRGDEEAQRSARDRFLQIALEASRAVAFAHARGILHRDLKPDNIMVAELGDTQVADWGLACRVDDPDAAVRAGTPRFIAPEVEAGGRSTTRSDVWSLGRILACGLGLERSEEEVAEAGAPPALPPPEEVLAIVRRASAADPEARYATAGELAADLERYLSGERVHAHAYSAWALAGRLVRLWRVPLAVAAVALVLTIVVVSMAWQETAAERDRAVAAERDAELARAQDAARLAALLRTQAIEAEARGAFAEAGIMAARSLELGPSPEALAVLMALEASARPEREEDPRLVSFPSGARPIPGSRELLEVDATRVALIGRDGQELWEAPGAPVTGLAFDPGGARALLQVNEKLEELDLATGARRPIGNSIRFGAALAIDHPRRLALDANRGVLNLWDLSGAEARSLIAESLACPGSEMLGAALVDARAFGQSPDADAVAVCHDATLRFVGQRGASALAVSDEAHVISRTAVVAARRGVLLVGTLEGEVARVRLDGVPRVEVLSRRPDLGRIEALDISPGEAPGFVLVQAQRDGPRVLDLEDGGVALSLPKSDRGAFAWRSPDTFATVGARAAAWRVPIPASPHRLSAARGVGTIATSPDGRLVAAAGGDGIVSVFDLETGRRRTYPTPFDRVVKQVAFSPEGERLALGGMGLNELVVLDRATGATRGLETLGQSRRLGWLRGGALFAVTFVPDVRFWTSPEAAPRDLTPPASMADPQSFGWIDSSPVPPSDGLAGDERVILIDNVGGLWVLSAGRLERVSARGPALAIAALGGEELALAERGRLVVARLDGQQLREAPLESTTVDLVVSPDGRFLASSDTRGRVEVRRMSDLTLVAGLEAHRERAAALSWGPRRLVSGSWDASVRVWNPAVLDRAPTGLEMETLWGLPVNALDAVR